MQPITFGRSERRGRPRNDYQARMSAQRERGRAEKARIEAAEAAFLARARNVGGEFTIYDIVGYDDAKAFNNAHTILARLDRHGRAEKLGRRRGCAMLWRLIGAAPVAIIPAPVIVSDDLGPVSRKERAWRLLRHLMHIEPQVEVSSSPVARYERAARYDKEVA